MQSQEWEGFQSFAEQTVSHSGQNILEGWLPKRKQPLPKYQSQISICSAKSSVQNKKKISFKPNCKRKISFLHSSQNNKGCIRKSQESMRPELRRASVNTESSCKKDRQGTKCQKEERIPVYRFPNMCQMGKLVYKGHLPLFANEYLTLYEKQEQGLRQTTKSSMAESIRYSAKGMQDSQELVFDSKFQNGNLDLVRKFNNEYHLFLAPDTNTKGHRQWFYFHIYSHSNRTVQIVIHGFKKKLSLFQQGMKPYGKKIDDPLSSWGPIGSSVLYLKEEKKPRMLMKKLQFEYCLRFALNLEKEERIEVASCIPYTYSYLKDQLSELHTNSDKMRRSVLCKTLMGLEVPLLTFGQVNQKSRFVVINGRIHPGQSSSSWVMQGIIEYLCYSKALLKVAEHSNLVIKVVPMLNPDGVYMGNYRTGVMGIDYNRLFLSGKADVFPEVEALKQLVKSAKEQGGVDLYLDLHGHSIHPGCFIYGPDPCFCLSSFNHIQQQLLKSPSFAAKHCKAGTDQSKKETSRIYFQLHQNVDSLTCENSLGLLYSHTEKGKTQQFDIFSWKQFGTHLISSVLSLYDGSKSQLGVRVNGDGEYLGKEDDIEIEKSKTDAEDLSKSIDSLRSLNLSNIDLNPHFNQLQSDYDSINDSDDQSEDLTPTQHQNLFGIVSKIVKARNPFNIQEEDSHNKIDSKNPAKKPIKGICMGTFKEYHFAHDSTTVYDWFARKRLLSVPKVLKTEKINQSYIIRKVAPSPFENELTFESMKNSKRKDIAEWRERVKTESRQRVSSRASSYLKVCKKQEQMREEGEHLKM